LMVPGVSPKALLSVQEQSGTRALSKHPCDIEEQEMKSCVGRIQVI
jgi:hypothetical protein